VLFAEHYYAECHAECHCADCYAKFHYTENLYAAYHYAECHCKMQNSKCQMRPYFCSLQNIGEIDACVIKRTSLPTGAEASWQSGRPTSGPRIKVTKLFFNVTDGRTN
jgi:hypothetical protein